VLLRENILRTLLNDCNEKQTSNQDISKKIYLESSLSQADIFLNQSIQLTK